MIKLKLKLINKFWKNNNNNKLINILYKINLLLEINNLLAIKIVVMIYFNSKALIKYIKLIPRNQTLIMLIQKKF